MTTGEDQARATLAMPVLEAAPAPVAGRRHVLDLDDWTPDDLSALLSRAEAMRELLKQPEVQSMVGVLGCAAVQSHLHPHLWHTRLDHPDREPDTRHSDTSAPAGPYPPVLRAPVTSIV